MPLVSVIMRTKNNEDTLTEALSSLFQQDFQDFELIIVDSGSVDRTLEIAAHYPHRLIHIRPQDYFPGKVLNAAAEQATGKYLVFQNSDVVLLHDHALSALVAPLENNPAVCASFARQKSRPEAQHWVQRDYAKSFPESNTAPQWMPYSLPFAAMRYHTWLDFPFYTWAWGSEDTEWGYRQRERDPHSIVYVPEAEVMHSHNYTLTQIYGRSYIEGEADAWMRTHHRNSLLSQSTSSRIGKRLVRASLHALKDAWQAWSAGRPGEALGAWPRRLMWEWGHEQGFRWGLQRLTSVTHENSSQRGQRMVLNRHCSRRDETSEFSDRRG